MTNLSGQASHLDGMLPFVTGATNGSFDLKRSLVVTAVISRYQIKDAARQLDGPLPIRLTEL